MTFSKQESINKFGKKVEQAVSLFISSETSSPVQWAEQANSLFNLFERVLTMTNQ